MAEGEQDEMRTSLERARGRYRANIKDASYRNEEKGWASLARAVGIADPDEEDQLKAVEDRATLETLLPHLTERQRFVLERHELDELTYGKIGKMIGISNVAAREIEVEAIKKLKSLISSNESVGKFAR